jgi:sugar fermentation stimulation protein A
MVVFPRPGAVIFSGQESSGLLMSDSQPSVSIPWPPLVKARLVRRYKRFLADVVMEDGSLETVHTPNTGTMLDCSEPGRTVYLRESSNSKRKHRHSWVMIDMPDGLVGVDTLLPNKLARLALLEGAIAGLPPALSVGGEVPVGRGRLDLMLRSEVGEVWVEVKNCTLVRDGTALFPDAVTARGARHLEELAGLVAPGRRAALLVMVQRGGARRFSPADHIDPVWGKSLREAKKAGVEIYARQVDLSPAAASLGRALEIAL